MKTKRTKMIEKADKEFSLYIRMRDMDKNEHATCFTCGNKDHWKRLHCGHFMSRRHINTRWDELNVAVQCVGCNTFRGGEQFIFGQNIDKKEGIGTSAELLRKSREVIKLNVDDIEKIWLKYKNINKRKYDERKESS